jgi:hypothetical protein
MTLIPPEFHVGEHIHNYDAQIPEELAPILFASLIGLPIVWYFSHKKRKVQ